MPWSTCPITVTTGARVTMSAGDASPPSVSMTSSSKLRICTSAPNSRASIVAVSVSSVELMVIISRFISSFPSTSLTRTSSLSARSFTVMPSASVIVRETGGGACCGGGADGRTCSRRAEDAGRAPPVGRIGGRGGMPGRCGYEPGRGGNPGCCARIGCEGSGRGPPGVGRGPAGPEYAGTWTARPRRTRPRRRARRLARRPRAARPQAAWPGAVQASARGAAPASSAAVASASSDAALRCAAGASAE